MISPSLTSTSEQSHPVHGQHSTNNMTTNGDIVKFMQQLQLQMETNAEKINTNIKVSNEKLENQIREGRDKVKQEMQNLSNKIKEVTEETDRMKKSIIDNKVETEHRFKRMEERLEDLTTEGKKISAQKRKREETLKEAQQPKQSYYSVLGLQPAGSETVKSSSGAVNTDKSIHKITWVEEMSQVPLDSQLQLAKDAADRLDDKGGEQVRGRPRKKRVQLGDSAEFHDNNDWPWDMCEEDWEGTADRQARNKKKKIRAKKKRLEKIEKAALVAQCMVGLRLVKQESFVYFNKITADFSEAKKMAAAEFLTEYLKFSHEDMSDMDITDTKISAKGDDILYVVLDCPDKACNIRRRIADCRNPAIKTREFIPPQFYKRYNALSKYASDRRKEDTGLKTQICFGKADIALYTKRRGSEDPFIMEDLSEIDKQINLPDIEHNVSWKRREELPKWRKVSPDVRVVQLKSLGWKEREDSGSSTEQNIRKKTRSRQNCADSSPSPGSTSPDADNVESPASGKNDDMCTSD